MLTVYVRRYLTPEGIRFFKNQWFPKVLSIIGKQKGFISIVYKRHVENKERIDMTLKFTDEPALDAWCAVPVHDELTAALNPYQTRDYWEAVRTFDHEADPDSLEWDVIRIGE